MALVKVAFFVVGLLTLYVAAVFGGTAGLFMIFPVLVAFGLLGSLMFKKNSDPAATPASSKTSVIADGPPT